MRLLLSPPGRLAFDAKPLHIAGPSTGLSIYGLFSAEVLHAACDEPNLSSRDLSRTSRTEP